MNDKMTALDQEIVGSYPEKYQKTIKKNLDDTETELELFILSLIM